jgi:cyanophycin synthetase
MGYKFKFPWKYKENYWFCPGVNIYGETPIFRVYLKELVLNLSKNKEKLLKDKIKKILNFLGEEERVFFVHKRKQDFLVFTVSRERIAKIIFEQAWEAVQKDKKIDDETKKILKKEWYQQSLNSSAAIVFNKAKELDYPVWRFDDKHLLVIGEGKYRKFIRGSRSSLLSSVGTTIAKEKSITREILTKLDLPMAKGRIASSVDEGVFLSSEIGFPLVIKPVSGAHGKGVKVGIKDKKSLKMHLKEALKEKDQVIIEKQVLGSDFRILVIDYQFVAAAKRIPANVIGNGESSIKDLINKENKNPERGRGHSKPLTKIEINEELKRVLKSKDLSLKSIPNQGEQVFLRKNANLSTGGEGIDVTDSVCRENIKIFERIARATDLKTVGIDVMADNLLKPLKSTQGAVLEINASPGLRMHHFPSKGKPRDGAKKILQMLFPKGQTRIPLIAVTGTNGKTTVTKLTSHILEQKYDNVGWSVNAGAGINKRKVFDRVGCGGAGARSILHDSKVEAAVLETTQNTIWSGGLGFDWVDSTVVTNIAEDHIGTIYAENVEGIINNKGLLVERTMAQGRVVLNADDENVRSLKKKSQAEVVWFSLKPEKKFVKQLLKKGAVVYAAQDGWIVELKANSSEKIIKIEEIPLTLSGYAEFNIANCLAATAILWNNRRFGIKKEQLIKGLRSFDINQNNPGRMNQIQVGNKKVFLDYAHNYSGYREVAKYLNGVKTKYSEIVVVPRVAGDRPDEQISKICKLIGEVADKIYLKEPVKVKMRGAEPGRITRLFKNFLLKNSFEKDKIFAVKDEIEANKTAVEQAKENALIYISLESTVENMQEVLQKGATPQFKTDRKNKSF